jgi:GT2 family glycosyltransferase
LVANDYPKDKLEIIIVDGYSKDNTRKIVNTYIEQFSFIKIVDNPGKIFPAAVNIGIKISTGDPILIIGSHAVYDKRYLLNCIQLIDKTGADNVGGVLITRPKNDNFIGRLVVSALTNRFGVGSSAFRTGAESEIETDTVFGGCYRRDVFEKIGLFNENLISTSDYEFNNRLKKRGGMIFLSPEIRTTYFTRSSLKEFIMNNVRNGFWSVYPMAYVNYLPISFRHLVPLIFVIYLFGTTILSFFFPFLKFAILFVVAAYLSLAYIFSMKERDILAILLLPVFFIILHISYGLGSLYALIKLPFVRKST